jgi:hypothetical protein
LCNAAFPGIIRVHSGDDVVGHKDNALVIPETAIKDPQSTEMLRAWVAQKALHCSLRIGVWKEPAAWGILLADVARHVANAHQEADGRDRATTLAAIRKLFNAELDKPTDEPKGSFVKP